MNTTEPPIYNQDAITRWLMILTWCVHYVTENVRDRPRIWFYRFDNAVVVFSALSGNTGRMNDEQLSHYQELREAFDSLCDQIKTWHDREEADRQLLGKNKS